MTFLHDTTVDPNSAGLLTNRAYPEQFDRTRPLVEQVKLLANVFSLSADRSLEFAETVVPTLTLPEPTEGWYAFPSYNTIAEKFFPAVRNRSERYCRALCMIHELLQGQRSFFNFCAGQIQPDTFRLNERTAKSLGTIAQMQEGDIRIVPAQFGSEYVRCSAEEVRQKVAKTRREFCLDGFVVGCMLFTHPERLVHHRHLQVSCPGDERRLTNDEDYTRTSLYRTDKEGVLKYGAGDVGYKTGYFGSATAVIPG